ncbi:uncharacterized protein LOC111100868 [Crassostrea virginica]
MWLIPWIGICFLAFPFNAIESSRECSDLEVEGNISSCWDPEGQAISINSSRHGTICLITNKNILKSIVKCTTRGWSAIEKTKDKKQKFLSRKKRVIGLIVYAVICFFFDCRPRDNTPPSMKNVCPKDIYVTADKYQVDTQVSWLENDAWDKRDGRVSAHLMEGKPPGRHFSGETKVAYMARDSSGNTATCSFFVFVQVIRCPIIPHIPDGYYMCHPSDEMIYGTVCKFGCYDGHDLKGGIPKITCTKSGKWSGAIPRCQKLKCPRLPPVLPSSKPTYICSDDNNFRSKCMYSCPEGYDIASGMTRVRVCTEYRTWRGAEPKCKDIEPPKFKMCEGFVIGFTSRNSNQGQATWNEPVATDNHDKNVKVSKDKKIYPGQSLKVGLHSVTYRAWDIAGNEAIPCVVKILIKAITCPNIYPKPFQTVACPNGTGYGSMCNITCEEGTKMHGPDVVICERKDEDMFGHWTWGENQTYCEVIRKCTKTPDPPKNGALACDRWFGGQFCQMLCMEGYDVLPGTAFEEMVTCGDNGKWLPEKAFPLPDCSKSLAARSGIYMMAASCYFNGDCTSPETQQEIKETFIEKLNGSQYRDACSIAEHKCSIENVQVICGETRRRKRSVEMVIKFDIKFQFEKGSKEIIKRANHELILTLQNSQTKGELDIVANTTGILRVQNIQTERIQIDCPPRTIASLHTLSCVECTPGTFYDNETQTCPMCERGYYQDQSGQMSCEQCQNNTTTRSVYSKNITDCIEACRPGYWSIDGTPACSLCPVGSFSNTFGMTRCQKCAYSQSTEIEGATSESHCQDFDVWITDEKGIASIGFETMDSFNESIVSLWLQKDNETSIFSITLRNTNTTSIINIEINENISLSTLRTSNRKHYTSDNRWQFLLLSIRDNELEVYVDNEVIVKVNDSFQLWPSYLYEIKIEGKGKVSQLNMWSSRDVNHEDKLTAIMTTKRNCSLLSTGDIVSWKEFENVNLDFVFKQFPSDCDDWNSCISNPCLNGICQDKLDGFECHCQYGFFGDTCEWNIDDCDENACANNSTCQDGSANYTCLCKEGFKGDLCEIAMVDGGWGKWNEWTPCSVTCGNGTQRRHRYCNNPAPDNGGIECPGNSTEIRMCSMEECRVCGNLSATEHVNISCEFDSNNTNCTISCEEGYEFDHTAKPFYLCGEATYHFWDFKTSDNPEGKLPQCIERKENEGMSFTYSAAYADLFCDSSEKVIDSKNSILQKVKQQIDDLNCIQNATCALEKIDITNCQQRFKRDIQEQRTDDMTAGFDLKITCDPGASNSEECYNILSNAFQLLLYKTNSSLFSTMIHGLLYHIQPSSANVSTKVKCHIGEVSTNIYCVECSNGRYYKNDECLKCDYGEYQDETGQTSCKKCPSGSTTPGRESRSVDECSVLLQHSNNEHQYFLIGVLSGVSYLVLVTAIFLVFRKCLHRRKKMEIKLQDYPEERHAMVKLLSYKMFTEKS